MSLGFAAPGPPPFPKYLQQQTQTAVTTSSTSTSTGSSTSCKNTAALACEQGATLKTKMVLTVDDPITGIPGPVDVTGSTFQFTAKIDVNHSDSDPTTVQIDWSETTTPTQGITYLVIPAATTTTMQTIAYVMQVRLKSASGVVSPLLSGTLTITQPISARY